MIEIYKSDNSFEIAIKIFENLEVHQSVTVYGFELEGDDVLAKGEIVVKEMIELDLLKNCKNGKRRRVRTENQIGDFVAQKAFKWAKRTVDDKVRYDIWRIQ